MFVLFNKNKEFVGYSPDIPDNPSLLKKEIPKDKSNINIWKWEGDYDTGKMIYIENGYPIEEIELENELFDFIDKHYPIGIQIINILKQIKKIIEYKPEIQDENFLDMADCVLNAMDKYNKRIKYHKTYSTLISKDESKQQHKHFSS